MKRLFLAMVALLLLSAHAQSDESVNKKLLQNAQILEMMKEELSKGLPKKIDAYTTFVGVDVEGQTFIYIYEINAGAKSDESIRKNDMPRMKKIIIQAECRRSKIHFDNGMALQYRYKNAITKTDLFKINIEMKDCKEFYL